MTTITAEPAESLDDVEKQVEHKAWHFAGDFTAVQNGEQIKQHLTFDYVQKPLSYKAMLEFTGLIGRKIEESMRGPDGLSIDEMIESGIFAQAQQAIGIGSSGASLDLTRSDFRGIDALLRGVAKLASYVPDIFDEMQCIWLRVPRQDRPFLFDLWSRSPVDGGLSHDDGESMMSIFIRQNYKELEDFFVERLPRIAKEVRDARRAAHPELAETEEVTTTERVAPDLFADGSPQSKPSSPTPGTIPSQ